MARLYTGAVAHRVGVEELETQLGRVNRARGPLEVETGSLGVLSWNIRALVRGERKLILIPLANDEPGVGGRTKRDVPRRCFEHARSFTDRGLGRYVLPAEAQLDLRGIGSGASFSLPAGYSALTFGLGSARVDLVDDAGASVVRLGAVATAEATCELLAALAYHYDEADGSSIADVLINDGDFLVRRTMDGAFSVRLCSVRRLEKGIGSDRFLLYLIQLMAYEDWTIGPDLVGLPVAISDPLLAFVGFARGTALRFADLGLGEAAGENAALRMIESFGRGRYGRAYLPWIRGFLAGKKGPVESEPRRPWWNLTELEQRRDLLRLREGEGAAEPLAILVRRLGDAIGVGSEDATGTVRVNDLSREGLLRWLEVQGGDDASVAALADAWFAGWPYRDLADLNRRLPILGPRLTIGAALEFAVADGEEEGTLAALRRLPKRPARLLANPEIYGEIEAEPGSEAELVRRLATFETYMDDVLHDPRFGYYAGRVVIGHGGHFSTHPEDLTPHYGRWIATWAFEVRECMVLGGKLSAEARFPVVEFGAGNGRLARDFIDAVRSKAASDAAWSAFSQRLDYRIYERSEALRARQAGLLSGDAEIVVGDARHPGTCLERDFPDGFRGFIVSNELPDAFGVHKVVLLPSGEAQAVLVLPQVSEAALERLSPEVAAACRAADRELRPRLLGVPAHLVLLDHEAFCLVLTAGSALADGQRDELLDEITFDELLVPVEHFEPLSLMLRMGADESTRVLAEEPSAVVVYPNVHATSYVRELAAVLACGQILTIDYGDTTAGLVRGARRGKFPLRIYCDEGDYEPRPNHPYTRPGAQDITADVNFTDLALAGIESGLDVAFFGPERAVAQGELPLVLRSTEQKPFANFAANTVFKVLALCRGVDFAPRGVEHLPLFLDERVGG